MEELAMLILVFPVHKAAETALCRIGDIGMILCAVCPPRSTVATPGRRAIRKYEYRHLSFATGKPEGKALRKKSGRDS
jgi:hypothetical protein